MTGPEMIHELPGILAPCRAGERGGGIPRFPDGIGGRCRHRASPGLGVRGRHPVCHRRLARLGDRHLVRGRGGLRQGRVLQPPDRHVPGDRDDHRGPGRGFPGGQDVPFRDRGHLRGRSASTRRTCRTAPGRNILPTARPDPLATSPEDGFDLPDGRWPAILRRARCPRRIRPDVRRRGLSGLLGIGSGPSRCWPWTRSCAFRSRFRRPPATS